MSQARISDPRLVRELRHEVLRFGEAVRGVLGGTVAGLNRVRDRLRLEQFPHWKRELLKREEAYQEARRRYLEAEDDQRRTRNQGGPGRSSSEEEQREMNRARRRREEAEEKLEAIRRWMLAIEKEGEILAHRCLAHDLALRDQVAAAGVRLEQAAAALDGYHDAVLPPASGAPPQPVADSGLRPASQLLLRGLRPHTPESLRAATLPIVTWQVNVAARKNSTGEAPRG